MTEDRFLQDYQATFETYSSTEDRFINFCAEGRTKGIDSVPVRVIPKNGPEWFGSFKGGKYGGVTGLFSTPSPLELLVVVDGEGYWVNTEDPRDFTILQVGWIRDIQHVVSHQLIVFADSADLYAHRSRKLLWRTNGLGIDGVRFVDHDDNSIYCEVFEPVGEETLKAKVSLSNGAFTR